MSSGSWTNSDGLYLQFGTAKSTAEVAGEFHMPGPHRIIEIALPLASVSSSAGAATTPYVASNTVFFPAGQNIIVDKVELENENITSTTPFNLSIGLVQGDRTTVPTTGGATAFVNGISNSTLNASSGTILTLTGGSAGAGGLIGLYATQWNTNSLTSNSVNSVGGYVTAQYGSATTGTGTVRCRIFYHGVGAIPY